MLECVIVGGGIHGTYLTQRLLEETGLDREAVAIVDPHERLLESFRRKAHACGMESLRSTFVHHVGTEPFGLEDFAEARDREDELRPRAAYPPAPTLSLFLDYADYVIDRNDLETLHLRAAVESIGLEKDGTVSLETDACKLRARSCVLAIGHGGRYRYPAWAADVDGLTHVWDGEFDPDDASEETIVVGGGVTAAQLATHLTGSTQTTLLARHDLEAATIEADARWINWNHITDRLHRHPPGSKRRHEVVCAARNDGTIPPALLERLESAVETGELTRQTGSVRSARTVDGRVRLLLEEGGCLSAEQVMLATGFEPVLEHPFVEQVATRCGLERGYRGMPILDDETLCWRTTEGRASPIYVSGALAVGTVGPLAGNIAGARRAADRITDAIDHGRPAQPISQASISQNA